MPFRPNLEEIEKSYAKVLANWKQIDDQLEQCKVGRKDTPFDKQLMDNMLSAWEYIDYFIKKKDYSLLSNKGGVDMLELNHRVHYGVDNRQRAEYNKAIKATTEKYSKHVLPIRKYYQNKVKNKTSVSIIASEIYVAILGQPQLYIEGNHRSGSIVASWVHLEHNRPPFVLSIDNALAFFRPAQEIKKFNKRSMWRSLTKLPKHKSDFRKFWVNYCDMKFVCK